MTITTINVLYADLNPCPWCKKTPLLWMPLEGDSWQWTISCGNSECTFKPKGRHVVVRKSQRYSLQKIATKLEILCSYWNSHNFDRPYERLQIPLEEWQKWLSKANKQEMYESI